MTAKPQPPSSESEREGSSSPTRPTTRPAQLTLDAELCDFYLMAVVRDKKPADAEKMAQFLWGEDSANVVESEALSVYDEGEGLNDGAMPYSTPFRLSSAGQHHILVEYGVWESARPLGNSPVSHYGNLYRKGGRRVSSARPSWLLRPGSQVPDADISSHRPWMSLGRRWEAMWASAGSDDVPSENDSLVPPQPKLTRHSVDSCSSSVSSTSWSSGIASNPGPSPSLPSALRVPAPETATSLAPSLTPTPDDAPTLAKASPVQHSRVQEVAVPKPFNMRPILCCGGGETVGEPSRHPAKQSQGQGAAPDPFHVRQILCYGGGGPDESPETTRSTVRESSLPSVRPLTLSQLLGYGGGETDEEPEEPPSSPLRESLLPPSLSQRASRKPLKSRMSEELSVFVAGKQSVAEGRVLSPPAPPAPVAAMCAMRVKHGATGWI